MKKIWAKMELAILKTKNGLQTFAREEQGDMGVGQIAGIVAAVVVVGMIVLAITENLPDMLEQLWDTIMGWFDLLT